MRRSTRAKRMDRHHRRMHQGSRLNLVSLMDIFTILVFFLMVNSSDIEILQTNPNIRLPDSTSEQDPSQTLLISVTEDGIVVQGEAILDRNALANLEGENIPELVSALGNLSGLVPVSDSSEQDLAITIMGDRDIPYTLLKKIMASCAEADFRQVSLAVNQSASTLAMADGNGANMLQGEG